MNDSMLPSERSDGFLFQRPPLEKDHSETAPVAEHDMSDAARSSTAATTGTQGRRTATAIANPQPWFTPAPAIEDVTPTSVTPDDDESSAPPRGRRALVSAGVAGALLITAMLAGAMAGAASAVWWLDTQVPTVGPELNAGLVTELAAQRDGGIGAGEERAVTAVRAARPAVVTIWNLQHVRRGGGPVTLSPAATGSGVIFDERGYIATNFHVVANAKAIEVIFLDGRRVKANVIGGNADVDVAILSVAPDVELPAVAPLADSSALEPGMAVMAIGSPLGTDYQNTVTNGIIAGLNRTVKGRGFNWFSFSEFEFDLNAAPLIQTDAAINTGNSGGPLINMDGRVVGLNTLIVRSRDRNDRLRDVEGLGFAVPSNVVRALAAEWIDGHVRGVPDFGFENVTPELAARMGLSRAAGVVVNEVPARSIAARSGLRVGDRITAIDGLELNLDRALADVLWGYLAGDTVRLTVVRDGAARTLALTLQPPP